MAGMSMLLQVKEISKVHNAGRPDEVRAVDKVSLSLEQGTFVAFKGPSGSGKTSLLSLLGCMSRPTEGSLRLRDRDIAKLPEHFLAQVRQQTFGFIFQQFNLIRNIKVLENILLPLYPQPIGFKAMQSRAEAILEQLDLGNKAHVRVNKLSGGEQQRVAIARALINQPEVIIADEPTAHLDSRLATELMEILGRLNEQGKTILIATHDPYVFNHPRIVRSVEMHDGRLVEGG